MVEEQQGDVIKKQRRKTDPLAAHRACRRGDHQPSSDIITEDSGLQRSKCRVCGCELARIPVLRRWFRSGMLG